LSQSLCFQGVLLRKHNEVIRRFVESQSLCFQGVLLRFTEYQKLDDEQCLNPFVFRAYYCGKSAAYKGATESLNPFVFRAYYCDAKTNDAGRFNKVSIPLFSGRITAEPIIKGRQPAGCLNPFVFRAYYCGGGLRISSTNRRLNPFVFRAYYCELLIMHYASITNVSIPLFSGRITAVSSWGNAWRGK